MAYNDLREFVSALERAGELKRIPFEVDPYLEITEFADRSVKRGGPALLFERPKGSTIPVLINAFASMRRMEIALQVESVDEVAARISEFLEMRMPQGLINKLKMLPKLAEVGSFFPRIVNDRPMQGSHPARRFLAARSPVLHCWPLDGGRSSRLPMVFSKNPDDRQAQLRHVPACRCTTTAPPACTGRRTSRAPSITAGCWQQGRKRMDVAVAIGCDPATMYSAILPLPPDLDEMMISGFLRGKPVEMVKCETSDIEVPANAEIVLEGYLELGEMRTEGPFGDHTGFYSLEDEYPVFHVTCVTHRRNPIYPTTIVGPPPMEDFYMGKAIERIFLPLMRMQLPEVRDICMPAEGDVSQPDPGVDPQILPGARAQSDARDLGSGAGDVQQMHRGGG